MTEIQDARARALLSPVALASLEALPALLQETDSEALHLEGLAACENHESCMAAIELYFALPVHVRTIDHVLGLMRWEYLARQMVLAYGRELTKRQLVDANVCTEEELATWSLN